MSTKVGIIAEGPIDHILIPPLLERIARDRAGYDWPVLGQDIAEVFQIRKRGHGGVLETVHRLVIALDDPAVYSHAFFVILLDRRTRAVHEEIRQLLVNHDRFVLAVAIEEIEAWWLGDRENTLAWSELKDALPDACRYAQKNYRSERDGNPKATLDELTRLSDRFDRTYGKGSVDLAAEFAEAYWHQHARLSDIRLQCPQGYRPFEKAVTQQFRSARRRAGQRFGRPAHSRADPRDRPDRLG